MKILNPHQGKFDYLRNRIIPLAVVVLAVVFIFVIFETRKADSPLVISANEIDELAKPQNLEVTKVHSGEIASSSSLYAELLNFELPDFLIAEVTTRFAKMFDLTRSKPGDTFKLFVGPDSHMVAFEYQTIDWKRYRLDKEGLVFLETVGEVKLDKFIRTAEGRVAVSLWEALSPLLPDMNIFFDMVEVFGWEIDFLTEPRIGDSFKIIYEVYEKDRKFVKAGKILAVEYVLESTPHRAFLFTDPDGHQDYYDENGYSMRKALLKSPLNYRRISSRFSYGRLHPIRKIYRPHLGVDYAAPTGTPITTSGDGFVLFKGWKTGFGNYVEIKHSYGLVTCYGHLSKYAKGLTKGRRVAQGQVIGYVGSTGESTGPHLDYRIRRNGRYINPLRMTIPAALPVKPEHKELYYVTVAEYLPKFQNNIKDKLFARVD